MYALYVKVVGCGEKHKAPSNGRSIKNTTSAYCQNYNIASTSYVESIDLFGDDPHFM